MYVVKRVDGGFETAVVRRMGIRRKDNLKPGICKPRGIFLCIIF
jgi:hypothetical protein